MKRLLILLLFPLMMFAQDSTLIGDVDCSGEVNSQDASLILQFVTNVIDSLPCEANMTGLTPDQLQEMIDMMDEQLSINYTAGSGGGFDFIFPDRLNNIETVHHSFVDGDYVVPEGKNLYILNLSTSSSDGATYLNIENILVYSATVGDSGFVLATNSGANNHPLPIIASSGEILSSPSGTDGYCTIHGFLVDKNVESFHYSFVDGNYIVPEGKNLFILNLSRSSSDYNVYFYIEDVLVYQALGGVNNHPLPIIAGSGETLSSVSAGSGYCTIYGYLVDEDYFSSVGSSSIGNGTENENTQNEDGSIVGSPVDNSEVNGTRVYFLEQGNIMETDEYGSFSNLILDSVDDVYAIYLDNETQILYWIEKTSVLSGNIKKSNLSNFNPQLVSAFNSPAYLGSYGDISGFDVEDDKFYISGEHYLWMVENSVTTQLVDANTNIYDVCVDESGSIFYSQPNYLKQYDTNTNDVVNIGNFIGIGQIDCSFQDSKLYYVTESSEDNYIKSVNYDGTNPNEVYMYVELNNFDISDVKLIGDSDFMLATNYSLSKFNEENGLQVFLGLNYISKFISFLID